MAKGSHPGSLEPSENIGGWRRRESNPRTVPTQMRLFHPDFPRSNRTGLRGIESIRTCRENGGWLYLIQAVWGGPIKIGRAINPVVRLRELQVAHDEQLCLLSATPAAGNWEKRIHGMLSRAHIRGEWFEPGPVLEFFGISAAKAAKVRRSV